MMPYRNGSHNVLFALENMTEREKRVEFESASISLVYTDFIVCCGELYLNYLSNFLN